MSQFSDGSSGSSSVRSIEVLDRQAARQQLIATRTQTNRMYVTLRYVSGTLYSTSGGQTGEWALVQEEQMGLLT